MISSKEYLTSEMNEKLQSLRSGKLILTLSFLFLQSIQNKRKCMYILRLMKIKLDLILYIYLF